MHRFPDKDTYEWSILATDKANKVYMDMKRTHPRLPDKAPPVDKAPPAAKVQNQTAMSAEGKVLNRWLGTWKSVTTQIAAVWTPKEVTSTGTTTAKGIVNNAYPHDSGGEKPNRPDYFTIMTFDPAL